VVPTLVCDLDGVVWLADRAIAGSAAAVARLRSAGWRTLFVTNNSFGRAEDVEAKLASFGIPASGDVVTSAMAAAALVAPGERVLLLGGPGAREELERAGAVVRLAGDGGGPVDAVVVGYHRSFDYEAMREGAAAVRAGARFVATNDDATYPTPEGPIPGAGSIVAGVQVASGVVPVVAGKPYAPMAELVQRLLGPGAVRAVVGDRPDTDGRFAEALGVPFALVESGVTAPGAVVVPAPAIQAADLTAVVDALLGDAGSSHSLTAG
jgi:HAD superfamily hydrolase (TIGR01450 family)